MLSKHKQRPRFNVDSRTDLANGAALGRQVSGANAPVVAKPPIWRPRAIKTEVGQEIWNPVLGDHVVPARPARLDKVITHIIFVSALWPAPA